MTLSQIVSGRVQSKWDVCSGVFRIGHWHVWQRPCWTLCLQLQKENVFSLFCRTFSVVLTSFFVSKMFCKKFSKTRQTEPEAKRRFSQTSEGRIRRQSAVVIEMTKEVHLHGDIWWHLETLKITLKIHDFRSTWDWPWKPGQVPIGDEDSLHPKVCTQIESLMPYAALMRFATGIFMHCQLHCFHPFSVRREKRRNIARHNWCHIFCTEKTLKWIRNNLNTVKHPVVRKHWIRKDFITRSVNACIPFPFHRVKTAAKV